MSFTGPNILWGANIGEVAGLWNLGDNSLFNNHRVVEGNENFTREQKFKSLSLINTQVARFSQYTYPIFVKRGLWDAARLELGLFGKGMARKFFIDKARMSGMSHRTRDKLSLVQYPKGTNKDLSAMQMDYIRGEATPLEVLRKKKRKRKRSSFPKPYKNIMESLSFLDTI